MFSQFLAKDPEYFKKLLRPMVREKSVHSIILMITMSTGERAKGMARDIVEIYQETDKPMVVSWIAGNLAEEGYQILREAGIPLFMNTKKSVQAVRALIQYAELQKKRLAAGCEGREYRLTILADRQNEMRQDRSNVWGWPLAASRRRQPRPVLSLQCGIQCLRNSQGG